MISCFWSKCSDHKRCEAFGSCVARAQAGGKTFPAPAEQRSHLEAVREFMTELGEIMGMENGATPAQYLQRARDIRQWCADHQGDTKQAEGES